MGRIHQALLKGACLCLQWALRLRYSLHVKGMRELLAYRKQKAGFLFLPNHPAEIDPVIVMSLLGPHFVPRSIVVEHFYHMPFFRKLMDFARVIPVPFMEERTNKWRKKEVEKTISYIHEALAKGENFIVYPSGKLKRSGQEKIGGASLAHTILEHNRDVVPVLIRSTGLWGSAFSVGSDGKSPPFASVLWFCIKALLKNGIFFLPRRHVHVEIVVAPPLAVDKGRLECNRAMELFYNQYGDATIEPRLYVPYSLWGRRRQEEETRPVEVAERIVCDCPASIKKEVYAFIETLVKVPLPALKESHDLAYDLGLDSLDVAEIHAFLDRTYDASAVDMASLVKVQDVLLAAQKGQEKPALSSFSAQEKLPDFLSAWLEESSLSHPFLGKGDNLVEVFWNKARSLRSLMICADRKMGGVTYKKAQLIVALLAQELRILPGSYLGILLPSSIMANLCVLAALLAGKTPVMLNWTAGKIALDHMKQSGNFSLAVTSRAFLDRIHLEDLGEVEEGLCFIEDIRASLGIKKKIRAWSRSLLPFSTLSTKFPPIPPTAVLLFTSGSESLPKAVPLSHTALLENQKGALALAHLQAKDSLYSVLPPFHSLGFSLTGLLPLLSGVRVFYAPDPTDGIAMARDISQLRLSVVCLAPSFFRLLFSSSSPEELSSLQLAVSGAEKPAEEVLAFARDRLPWMEWKEGYGITECSPVVSLQERGVPGKGIGRPIPGVELCIIDPDAHEELPVGKEGEICIHGPSVFAGYAEANRGDPFLYYKEKKWYRSGDLGKVDSQGNLYITDRLKRIVKVGGEMLSLLALEEVLERGFRPEGVDVSQTEKVNFAVIPSSKEKAELLLCSIWDVQPEQVNAFFRSQGLPRIAKVVRVVQVAEIPLTGAGKKNYRKLSEQFT